MGVLGKLYAVCLSFADQALARRPDHGLHRGREKFHSFVKRRFERRWFPNASADIRNFITGLLVGFMTLPAIVLASSTQASVLGLALAFLALGLGYVSLYARMVKYHWCSPISFLLVKPAFNA